MNDATIQTGKDILSRIFDVYFNFHAILSLIICVAVALILGRLISAVLRKVVTSEPVYQFEVFGFVGTRADVRDDFA